MGLDIYFLKHKKSNNNHKNDQEVGYFRKANFLVERFDPKNCEDKLVTKQELEQLHHDCSKVYEYKAKPFSYNTLPTQEGFFFGSTDYDEYYYEKVKAVRDWSKELLEEFDFNNYDLYIHCWW